MDCLGKFSSEVRELPCFHLCAGRTSYNKDIKLMTKQTAFLYFQDKSSTYKSTNGQLINLEPYDYRAVVLTQLFLK